MPLDTQIITASMDPLVLDPRFNWQNHPVKLACKGKGGDTENSSGSTAVAGGGGGGVNVWNAVTITDPDQCSILINTLTSSFFDEGGAEYGARAGGHGLNGSTGGTGGGGYPDVAPDVSHTGGNGGNPQPSGTSRGGGGGGESATETSDGNAGSNASGSTGGPGGTGNAGADGGAGGNHNADGNDGTGDGAGAGGPGRGSKLGKSGGAGKVEITGTLWEAATSDAGADQEIEFGETVQLAGVAGGDYESVLWTRSGDGTFDDATALDAVYAPGAADIASGTVTLTLTVTPDGDNYYTDPAVDTMVVTITVAAGYEIYVNKDREWQTGDVPVAIVPSSESSFETAIAGLGLLPSSVYFVSVIAFTANGRSAPVSVRFVTDDEGTPELRPSIVANLTVTAQAGGRAVVRWTYDEPSGIGRADTFSIVVESLGDGDPIDVDDVACGPAREYQTAFTGPDGGYRVKVYSKAGGIYESAVTGVDVLLDGTPPVGEVPPLAVL